MKEIVLIPQERIKIFTKEVVKKIESSLNVKISIQKNSVEIDGEGVELFQGKNIAKAVGRGFSPEKAFRLLNEEEQLEVINIEATDKKIDVIKSRLIGTQGKAREMIEKCSGAYVSIYGKTVSMIGSYQQLGIARKAINMIIGGAKHSNVYRFLQQAKT